MPEKFKALLRRIWAQCRDVHTIVLFLLVVAVLYTPAWGGLLLYALTRSELYLAAATSWALFWAGPFTPFFPLCLAITAALRRLNLRYIRRKKERGDPPPDDETVP